MAGRQVSPLWKMFFLMIVLCFILMPSMALAHTGLEQSTPKDGETVKKVKEITLQFESKVEKRSSFSLTNETGELVPVDQIQINDKVMSGKVTNTIPNGSYTVDWKIIGTDGHPIEGKYSFVVKGEMAEKPQLPAVDPASQNQTSTPETKIPTVTPDQSGAQMSASGRSPNSNIIMWIVIAIIVVALVCIVVIFRKKVK
jgi:methionine-rich copper-binding protein CopC